MAKAEENPERVTPGLPPLASALHTFAGRDHHGVLYPRLSLMSEAEQLVVVPRFNHYIIQHTAQEYPTEHQRTVNLFRAFHHECLMLPDEIPIDLPDTHKAFEDFATGLFPHKCVSPDGSVDQAVVTNLIGLAGSNYATNPYVRQAKAVRSELIDDELDTLGNYTLAATVAFVDVLATFEKRIIATMPTQQPTVA